jgi:hypothetical protein
MEDWHVLALGLIVDEEQDGVATLGEAKKLFDPVVMTFVLDGAPLETVRVPGVGVTADQAVRDC